MKLPLITQSIAGILLGSASVFVQNTQSNGRCANHYALMVDN